MHRSLVLLLALLLPLTACTTRYVSGDDDDDDSAPSDDDDATPPDAGSCDSYPTDTGDDTVWAVQSGDIATGSTVTLEGLVVTAARYNGVWAQEPGGGTCSGIWIYVGADPGAYVGTTVNTTGVVEEFYDLTEVNAEEGSFVTLGSGPEPEPQLLTLSALQSPGGEDWEGVLVRIEDVTVQAAPSSEAYWEWTVTDGTYIVTVDEQLYSYEDGDPAPGVGVDVDFVQGPLNHTFSTYKIAPRDANDVSF